MATPARTPILLDTDIGSDIDDALCLGYLLAQPRCELLGITTVTGATGERAALAREMCRRAGRDDVPILAGASGPLLNGPGQPEVPQFGVLGNVEPDEAVPFEALAFLRDQIHERPGEITLLGIGPMTNLAMLFALDPELPGLLKSLVLMAGSFFDRQKRVEWNVRCDPVAAAMVYRARPRSCLTFGLDVTLRCQISAAQAREMFQPGAGPMGVVREMLEVWLGQRDEVTFHDPLAAALVFEPELCGYDNGVVSVDIAGERPGLTRLEQRGEAGPHRVCNDVRPEAFFQHYADVLNGSRAGTGSA